MPILHRDDGKTKRVNATFFPPASLDASRHPNAIGSTSKHNIAREE